MVNKFDRWVQNRRRKRKDTVPITTKSPNINNSIPGWAPPWHRDSSKRPPPARFSLWSGGLRRWTIQERHPPVRHSGPGCPRTCLVKLDSFLLFQRQSYDLGSNRHVKVYKYFHWRANRRQETKQIRTRTCPGAEQGVRGHHHRTTGCRKSRLCSQRSPRRPGQHLEKRQRGVRLCSTCIISVRWRITAK